MVISAIHGIRLCACIDRISIAIFIRKVLIPGKRILCGSCRPVAVKHIAYLASGKLLCSLALYLYAITYVTYTVISGTAEVITVFDISVIIPSANAADIRNAAYLASVKAVGDGAVIVISAQAAYIIRIGSAHRSCVIAVSDGSSV